jgi:hypothetical protein
MNSTNRNFFKESLSEMKDFFYINTYNTPIYEKLQKKIENFKVKISLCRLPLYKQYN